MKLSRRETMVGGVLGLIGPRPQPADEAVQLAELTKAELDKIQRDLNALLESFNKHTHYVTRRPRKKTSGV